MPYWPVHTLLREGMQSKIREGGGGGGGGGGMIYYEGLRTKTG